MIDGLVEVIAVLLVVMFGWLHVRQNKLEDQLEKCVKEDALEDMKKELHEVKNILTEVRVENAEWHGLMRQALEKNSEKS